MAGRATPSPRGPSWLATPAKITLLEALTHRILPHSTRIPDTTAAALLIRAPATTGEASFSFGDELPRLVSHAASQLQKALGWLPLSDPEAYL